MKRLISALLELTRLDAGQQHIKRKRFDFKETVHESVELIRPIAEEHGLKLISELAPIEITGDSGRLAQVVTNLLTNAIQYNKPHGEIHVKLESKSGLAVLTVADTGQGISPLDLPHVFKRFYRGDKSRTGASNAGLGLAICKAIVEAHSGTIEVESQEEIGTTFTIRLPI
jgi:signal transduction histidine kinase